MGIVNNIPYRPEPGSMNKHSSYGRMRQRLGLNVKSNSSPSLYIAQRQSLRQLKEKINKFIQGQLSSRPGKAKVIDRLRERLIDRLRERLIDKAEDIVLRAKSFDPIENALDFCFEAEMVDPALNSNSSGFRRILTRYKSTF